MGSKFTGVYIGYAIVLTAVLVVPRAAYWFANMWADYMKVGGPEAAMSLSIPWYLTTVFFFCLALDIVHMLWCWEGDE